jgi:hypothetical protein
VPLIFSISSLDESLDARMGALETRSETLEPETFSQFWKVEKDVRISAEMNTFVDCVVLFGVRVQTKGSQQTSIRS